MSIKKTLTAVLASILCVGALTVSAMACSCASSDKWDGTTIDRSWYDEDPTASSYTITTAAQLAGVADVCNNIVSNTGVLPFKNQTIVLDACIDLNDKNFAPIGDASGDHRYFYGSFDGGNHTISNLSIETSAAKHVGLFGKTGNPGFDQTFTDVTIKNVTIDGNAQFTGALIGRADKSVIENVNVVGNIDISGYSYVGGLVGHSYAAISNCSVNGAGTIVGSNWQVGGLVGVHYAPEGACVSNCSVIGNAKKGGISVTAYNGAVSAVIGYAGKSGADTAVLDNLTATNVTVAATNDYGIGYITTGDFSATNSIATNVTAALKGNTIIPDDAAATKAIASVDGVGYTDIIEAFKAMEENSEFVLLDDVTITDKWDCRYTGTKFTVPVTINGNGYTLKFTNEINDGFNHLAVFRPEAAATFTNLTIDMSEAKSVFQNRFSVISSKDSDLTVIGCTFIGSETATAARAIIFGETAGDNNAEITVSDCSFTNFRYGVTDNMNAADVKSVTITESIFTNASVQVSASEEVVLTENTVSNGDVTVTSYSDVTTLKVTANENKLDEKATNYINANEITTDSEEFDLPVADVDGKKFISFTSAVKSVEAGEAATITVLDDIVGATITVKGKVTIKPEASEAVLSADSTATTLENVIFNVEKDASLAIEGFEITGLSYIYAKEPDSISIKNCDINVGTVEVSGTNCPPAFVLFSSSNNGSVNFTFTGNTLLASPDATEDWYTYSHGIAGWNSIEQATIKNNTFGSENAPLGAAAIKLMNFVNGATVEVSGNTFYVESKDSTWGPDAIQFYQNNTRGNNYFVEIENNAFFVDDATAAIGVNTNAMGNPVQNAGGATVEIATNNTVNGKVISITDVIVFGNGINDEAYTRGYVGVGVEKDANEKIIGGWFNKYSLGLESALSDDYACTTDGAGYIKVVEDDYVVEVGERNIIFVEFEDVTKTDAEGEKLYNINLVASEGNIINRLNSVDLTFLFTQTLGDNEYEIIASNEDIAVNAVNNSKVRYEFHFNGKDNVADTANFITIAQVKFTGYGTFSFAVDNNATTNAAHATTVVDNIVDTFVPGGLLEDGTAVGDLDISDNTISGIVIDVPTRELTINITFPNAVMGNAADYQDMKVVISGADLDEDIIFNLGEFETGKDYYEIKQALTLSYSYNVTVSGAGYRTARYTVTMTDDKTLNFWNNVKDNLFEVEEGKSSSAKNVTFLAGDIVKDGTINIYDLSAVVSYFGEIELVGNNNAYAKYDLNRDGKIDSKDVAYVLVSWGK